MKLTKPKPTKTYTELFDIILTADKEESRKSARMIREHLHSSNNRGGFDSIKSIITNAPEEYLTISEGWRQENFVVAVSILYFLHEEEKNEPDFLFPWLFYLLQHKNGNIRQSAVRMLINDLGPLTVHIRCSEYEQSTLISEQSDIILLNMYIVLNNLLVELWSPKYKKYKYVSSLPACPYKSTQMVMSRLEYYCGNVYIKQLKNQLLKMFGD